MEEDFSIGYDLDTLAEQSGVSGRTIRFYTTEGILPPPSRVGRQASYNTDHLNRLILIRWLIHKGNSLTEIRSTIHELDSDKLQLLYDEAVKDWDIERKRNNDIRKTLQKASPDLPIDSLLAGPSSKLQSEPQKSKNESATFKERGLWRRLELIPGVELHISDSAEKEDIELITQLRQTASAYCEKRNSRRNLRRHHEDEPNLIDVSDLEE